MVLHNVYLFYILYKLVKIGLRLGRGKYAPYGVDMFPGNEVWVALRGILHGLEIYRSIFYLNIAEIAAKLVKIVGFR